MSRQFSTMDLTPPAVIGRMARRLAVSAAAAPRSVGQLIALAREFLKVFAVHLVVFLPAQSSERVAPLSLHDNQHPAGADSHGHVHDHAEHTQQRGDWRAAKAPPPEQAGDEELEHNPAAATPPGVGRRSCSRNNPA